MQSADNATKLAHKTAQLGLTVSKSTLFSTAPGQQWGAHAKRRPNLHSLSVEQTPVNTLDEPERSPGGNRPPHLARLQFGTISATAKAAG